MSSGLYIFRVENFNLIQQASTINDSLVLSIIIKIDDSPPQVCFTMPIALMINSGQSIDLGRWAETDPISVDDESIITVTYQVLNLTGGWAGPFDAGFNEFNQKIVPPLQALGSLFGVNVQAYANAIEGVLNFIYGSDPVPNCSGLVHLHSDQYLGARLAELTTGYSMHRPAPSPSVPLPAPGSGCNTPVSQLSLAVERVPDLIAAAGPAQSSDLSIILTRTVPLGPTIAFAFNPTDPTKFVEAEYTLSQPVLGHVSCVAPAGGSASAVSPIHLFALAQPGTSIRHGWRDETGWHGWEQFPIPGLQNLIALSSTTSLVDIFAVDASYNLRHCHLLSDTEIGDFDNGINPNANMQGLAYDNYRIGPGVSLAGCWMTGGFTILTGIPPTGNEMIWGNRTAGGLIFKSTFQSPDTWGYAWPYNDQASPSFMAMGPNAIVPTAYPNTNIEAAPAVVFAIGHDGGIFTTFMLDPQIPGNVYVTPSGRPNYGEVVTLNRLPGNPAHELAATLNPKTNVVWMAYIGTDQQVYVGGYMAGPQAWMPANAQFIDLGGSFIGRPLIVPDPSGATNRTFFFVLGLDNKIYWKYYDFQHGDAPDTGRFTPPGTQWASLPSQDGSVTITGPRDLGPVVQNASDPAANKQLNTKPTLSASDTQLKPGEGINAVGTAFPLDTTTQLFLQWPNTSLGTPAGAQIKFEIKGKNSANPIFVQVPSPFNGWYSYVASPLVPKTDYEFWARCFDSLEWSEWSSSPLSATTAATNSVDLILKSLDSPNAKPAVLGSADLSKTSSSWHCAGVIPQTTAPGKYSLVAELSGTEVAATNINVAANLLPILQVIDPATHQVISSPTLYGGSHFTIKGEGFPDGTVAVTLNGATVASASALSGVFLVLLTVPGDVNSNSQEITIKAANGAVSKSLSIETFGPPK